MKSVETIASELLSQIEGPLKETTEDDSYVASLDIDESHKIFVRKLYGSDWQNKNEKFRFIVSLVRTDEAGDEILHTSTTKSDSLEGLENAIHYLIDAQFGKDKTKDK
ncbi:hypothetical protein EAL2_c10320 [Peptoclostridium acidaminophilum DSM 3953]|uniref:Uncharacterized protein n=1 Tax=Peptoclostridium acidaminophilum DSM 3953 TaxID=1286171 RepID=W8T631_PEPAC|nr:hypothetical protein [Peptoclostridium acidaminophilum]AHM56330.1 hypothetical protein EAL2_c10320 [Peptoclostridium acidaminophilum DSM 3953]